MLPSLLNAGAQLLLKAGTNRLGVITLTADNWPATLVQMASEGYFIAGIAFYAAERVRYGHFVWHLFVLLGTVCHFFAVLWYAA